MFENPLHVYYPTVRNTYILKESSVLFCTLRMFVVAYFAYIQRWPWGEASWSYPHSCTSEGRCLALVSEASNDTVLPRLTSPRLPHHSQRNVQIYCAGWNACVSYATIAMSPTAATAAVSHWPPCLQSAPGQQTAPPGLPRPPLCLQTPPRHPPLDVTNGSCVTQCRRVTHYWMSLTASTSLMAPNGCHAIGQYYNNVQNAIWLGDPCYSYVTDESNSHCLASSRGEASWKVVRFASCEASQPPQGSERDEASQVPVSLASRPTRVASSRLVSWPSDVWYIRLQRIAS